MKPYVNRTILVGVLLGLNHGHANADEFVWHKIVTGIVGSGTATGVKYYATLETMLRDEAIKICGTDSSGYIVIRDLKFASSESYAHGSFNLGVAGCPEGSYSCFGIEETSVTSWHMYPPFSASAEISCRVRMK